MNETFLSALDELEASKGISKDVLMETIDAALTAAYKRDHGDNQNVRVSINRETGDIKVYALYNIVEELDEEADPGTQISLADAQKTKPLLNVGDVFEKEVPVGTFGRIAAQTAKQVVVQRIREAERGVIYNEFIEKTDEIITGQVRRVERGIVYIGLGRTEASMSPADQMKNEKYYPNDRIKVYVTEVKSSAKGPQVMVSRSTPGLVKRLFEMEVPEIESGIVEIRSIAREAGSRTKMAVATRDPDVDPVGACVGQRGMRVEKVVDELKGEKIDIVPWDPDPVEYIAAALRPAKVSMVQLNEEARIARVVVGDNQLSLAIGRDGQNARLAARLTGWKIDIKSQSQIMDTLEYDEENEEYIDRIDEDDYEDEAADDISEFGLRSELPGETAGDEAPLDDISELGLQSELPEEE